MAVSIDKYAYSAERRPMDQDTKSLSQPVLFSKWVKTYFASCLSWV